MSVAAPKKPDSQSDKVGKTRSFGDLLKEVVRPGFCISCGACAASCRIDAIDVLDYQPKMVGLCRRCGFCYYGCPQTGDPEKLAQLVFGETSSDAGVGSYKQAFSVKTRDPEIQRKCQNGGAVTSILVSLLDQGLIDAAVVMGTGDNPWEAEPKVACTREEIIKHAGTIYTPGPTLLGLRDAVDLYSKEKIAVVGTPCQVKALRRMQFDDMALYHLSDHLELVIGLFCMESFDYRLLKKFVEEEFGMPLGDVTSFEKEDDRLVLSTKDGSRKEMDLNSKDLRELVNAACTVCPDFASELADISIGKAGSSVGHSTVLVRTNVGLRMFDSVREKGDMFEMEPLEAVEPGIKSVSELAGKKRKSAEEELSHRGKKGEPVIPWSKTG